MVINMGNQRLTLTQLDRQIREWQALNNKYGKPKAGWIKTLRTALGMSAEQLANRLGLTRGRIVQLETAESRETVTLKTLNDAANALGCELIYAIVPKQKNTLQNIIETRAEKIAADQVARVAHSMSLEAQAVDIESLNTQQVTLRRDLIHHLGKKLWESSDTPNALADAILKHQLKNNKILLSSHHIKNALMEYEKKNPQLDLQNKINDPDYMKALQHAIARSLSSAKQEDIPNDLLKKLIENLKKKK